MRKILISGTIICVLSLSATHVHARLTKEYLSWMKGEFEIPEEIKKARNVPELQPFIESSREFTRMAAIRRLGQIEGPKAIGLLREVFSKEPSARGLHRVALVKLEILRTLGRIGTEQAKSAVLNIVVTYWKRGSQCGCKRCKGKALYPQHDRDYHSVTPAALKTLKKWRHDKKVLGLSKQIALDERLISTPVRVSAWELHLMTNMAKEKIATEKESLEYLVNFLAQTGIEPETYFVKGIRTLKSIKTEAVGSILKGYGEQSLSYLKEELKRTAAGDVNRRQALSHAIVRIRESLKSKKEKRGE